MIVFKSIVTEEMATKFGLVTHYVCVLYPLSHNIPYTKIYRVRDKCRGTITHPNSGGVYCLYLDEDK